MFMGMQASEVNPEDTQPWLLLGLPLSSWVFAIRTWAAMMIALCVAFWLQLDAAYDAGVTVAILAQPLRGQAFQKAIARLFATLAGTAVSLAIVGTFTQLRDLYIIVCSAWIGICAYLSTCYDGNRAYGIILSGYTVAFVAMDQIDTPQQAFTIGVNRVASISCGIVAVALINAVFAAHDVYPGVRRRLDQACEKTRVLVRDIVHGTEQDADGALRLIGEITGLRPDIEILPSEGLSGGLRASAGRSALVAMVRSIAAARGVATLSRCVSQEDAAAVREALCVEDADRRAALEEVSRTRDWPDRVMLARCALDLHDEQRCVGEDIAAFGEGRPARRRVRLPIHRDWQGSSRLGIRVFLVVAASGFLLTLGGWPAISGAWRYVGLLGGLASIRPNARGFAIVGLIVTPAAAVIVGVTEFYVLDGVDAFPLLALGFAVPVVAFALLSLSHKPMLHGTGALGLVFLLLIYQPSNPPNYSAAAYLFNACYAISAAVLFALLVFAFRPTTDKERRRWLVKSCLRDLSTAATGRSRRTPDEVTFLMADRMVRLSKVCPPSENARKLWLSSILLVLNLTVFAIRAHGALDRLTRRGAAVPVVDDARRALQSLDPCALRRAVIALMSTADLERSAGVDAVAALQFIATLTSAHRSTLRRLDRFAAV